MLADLWEFGELRSADTCLQIGNAKIHSKFWMLKCARVGAALIAQHPRALIEYFTLEEECAAFAHRDRLVRKERKNADVSECAGVAAIEMDAEGLSRVLNDFQLVLPSHGQDAVHVTDLAIDVHGHDCRGRWSDLALEILDVDIEGVRIAVDKDRLEPGEHGSRSRTVKSKRGYQYLAATRQVQYQESQIETECSVRSEHHVIGLGKLPDRRREGGGMMTLGDPPLADRA